MLSQLYLRVVNVCRVHRIFLKKFPSRCFANAKVMECNDVSAGFITCPNHETAKALARGMVEKNLVACVNIIPNITSIYAWENKVEEDSEFMLLIKTRSTRIPDVTDYIKKNHPYDVPEVISFKIDQGNPGYLDFVRTNTVENAEKIEK